MIALSFTAMIEDWSYSLHVFPFAWRFGSSESQIPVASWAYQIGPFQFVISKTIGRSWK